MNYKSWLTVYGWPALALVLVFSLFGGLFSLLGTQSAPRGPALKPAVIRYAPPQNAAKAAGEDTAEIRALYASDLFASARGNRFAAPATATNRSTRAPLAPLPAPLILSLPPTEQKAVTDVERQVINYADLDSAAPRRPSGASDKKPEVSIALHGDLKTCSIEPLVFQGLPLPAGNRGPSAAAKAWSVRAEVSVSGEGRVEHVLAESQDCGPELRQEIVKRLYRCRFANVSRPGRGEVIVSYPVYKISN